jgi:hypothetical protein
MRIDFMVQLPLIVACPPNKRNSALFRHGTCRNDANRRAKGVNAMLHGHVAGAVELEQTCLVGYQAIFLNKMSSHLIFAETSRQQVSPVHRAH